MENTDQPPSDCDCCGSVMHLTYTFTVCDMNCGEMLRADLECPYNDPIGFNVDECEFDHNAGGSGSLAPLRRPASK